MATWIRRAGIAALSLAALAATATAAVYALGEHAMARRYALPLVDLPAANGEQAVAHGRHLYVTRGCIDCHGEDGGGRLAVDAGPVGRFYGPNLTRGGRGAAYDLPRFEHAVRHAVSAEGLPLRFMPSEDWAGMSDADVSALYAFLRALPPVTGAQPPSEVGLLGRALHLAGELPLLHAELIDHPAASAPKATPQAAPTAEYGRYLAAGCTGCHGPGFAGGPVPGTPPEFADASNLTPAADGLAGWSEADFVRAMREGRRPDGRELDAFMPWRNFTRMSDVELAALWAYLRTVPARPLGAR